MSGLTGEAPLDGLELAGQVLLIAAKQHTRAEVAVGVRAPVVVVDAAQQAPNTPVWSRNTLKVFPL